MHAVNAPNTEVETAAAQYAFSTNGHLAVVNGGTYQDPENHLVWTSRTGKQEELRAPPQPYSAVHLFPDGRRILASTSGLSRRLLVWNLPNGPLSTIPFDGVALSPVVAPDGTFVVFAGTETGPLNLYRARSDGGGRAERLTTGEFAQRAAGWSPDGRDLLYVESHPVTALDIWALSVADRKARPIMQSRFNESHPAISAS